MILIFFIVALSCTKPSPHYHSAYTLYPPAISYDTTGIKGVFCLVQEIDENTAMSKSAFGYFLRDIDFTAQVSLYIDSVKFIFNGFYYLSDLAVLPDSVATWRFLSNSSTLFEYTDTNRYPQQLSILPDVVAKSGSITVILDTAHIDTGRLVIETTTHVRMLCRKISTAQPTVVVDSNFFANTDYPEVKVVINCSNHSTQLIRGDRYLFTRQLTLTKRIKIN